MDVKTAKIHRKSTDINKINDTSDEELAGAENDEDLETMEQKKSRFFSKLKFVDGLSVQYTQEV